MPRSEGKAAFLEGSAGLCPIMRGADVHRQWEEGHAQHAPVQADRDAGDPSQPQRCLHP
jgi:hypothetical protein